MRSPTALLAALLLFGCAKEPPAASPAVEAPPPAPPISVGLSAPAPAEAEAQNSGEQTILFSPLVACTRMMCPENSCCNTCTFLRWSKGRLEAEAGPGVEPLPSCTPDGCGACPSQLSATGTVVEGKLIVRSWALVAPTAEAPAP